MLEQAIKTTVKRMLARDFPHLELPAALNAVVTKAQFIGDYYEYNLNILDKDGQVDDRFPEVPGVKSRLFVEVGRTVTVLLPYGELNPVIISEVI